MFTAILQIFFIWVVVSIIWLIAEALMYGKITPRVIDDIVAVVIAVLIYFIIN